MRRGIIAYMREQRKALLEWVKKQRNIPLSFPDWDHFRMGTLKLAERMTPIIEAVWERAGSVFTTRVGLDPDKWSVVNPRTANAIQQASFRFAKSTNDSTSLDLHEALDKLHKELHEGIVEEGESVEQLTKRVQGVFDQATKSRARMIAQTETSRAVHAAQDDAAKQSGVVTGWHWQASKDACPICLDIAINHPNVRLGEPFAIVGKNPEYSHIYMPPAHPNCNCSAVQILITDPQPDFAGGPLIQPKGPTEEDVETERQRIHEQEEAILRGSEAWGAAPYEERYPGGRPMLQKPAKPPKPTKPLKPPKRRPRREEVESIAPIAAPAPEPIVAVPRPIPAPAEPPEDRVASMPIEHFADQAHSAAYQVPLGDRKGYNGTQVWVFDAWRKFHALNPQSSIETFKRRLVEASQERLVSLSRWDLPQALTPAEREKSKASVIRYGVATFHMIRLPSP